MAEKEKSLKQKSIRSTFSLFFQSGYTAVLGFVANVVLTIYVSPEIFGIYITVLSLISILNYFSDVGLAASLIQRDELTDDDRKTAFTIQQLLILTLVTLGYMSTGFIVNFYGLDVQGQYLFWALLISFFLSSLKTIPSIHLERALQFEKIVLVSIVENTTFYIVVAVLAIFDYGLMSFTVAVLSRAIVGLVLMYYMSFWIPMVGISKKSAKHLLSYGLQFQSIAFLAFFKDELVNIFLGKVIGFELLGFIGWAKKWAESVLRIIMDNLTKVMFPLYARIQKDTDKQGKILEKVLGYQSMILIPASIGMIFVMPMIVDILPRYEKWEPALPIFYVFVLSSLFTSFSNPILALFNGIGKVKISLAFMIWWTVMTWVLLVPLTKIYGVYGFPVTHLTLSLTFIAVFLKAKSMIQVSFANIVFRYLVAGIGMSAVLFAFTQLTYSGTYADLFLTMALGGITYYGILRVLFKVDLIQVLLHEVRSEGI